MEFSLAVRETQEMVYNSF